MITNDFSLLDAVLVIVAMGISALLLRRKVRDAPFWRATVTPLASIIGSGFLVVAPLLANIVGKHAVIAIVGIVLLALWVGAAIRFNILNEERESTSVAPRLTKALERLSDITLACAYVISITFYIRLMCGFVLAGFQAEDAFNADLMSTAVLAGIGIYGFRRGLHGLERLEEYSVTIKLAIIAALLSGLMWHDIRVGYDLSTMAEPSIDAFEGFRRLAGMLLIVQGFEASKYLGKTYPAPLRARSMLLAQIIAGVIYVMFVTLILPLMDATASETPSETAIIGLSRQITRVLPGMLVLGATMSQFSAAVADTIGAGGVVEKESRGRLSDKAGYLLVGAIAIALMWSSDIFEIVALASRAFALYYAVQAVLAADLALGLPDRKRRIGHFVSFTTLAVVLAAFVVFAKSVEG